MHSPFPHQLPELLILSTIRTGVKGYATLSTSPHLHLRTLSHACIKCHLSWRPAQGPSRMSVSKATQPPLVIAYHQRPTSSLPKDSPDNPLKDPLACLFMATIACYRASSEPHLTHGNSTIACHLTYVFKPRAFHTVFFLAPILLLTSHITSHD